jgi:hypothetical protein
MKIGLPVHEKHSRRPPQKVGSLVDRWHYAAELPLIDECKLPVGSVSADNRTSKLMRLNLASRAIGPASYSSVIVH